MSHKLVFVLGHQREELEKTLQNLVDRSCEIHFAVQAEQKGTADAVKVALKKLETLVGDPDIFIMGADAVLLKRESVEAFKAHHEKTKSILSVMTAHLHSPNSYGRIIRNSQGGLEKIVEAKDASADQLNISEFNAGFYLIKLSALREALNDVSDQNQSKEFYLTDIVEFSRKRSWLTSTVTIDATEAYGVNTQLDLALATRVLQQRINEFWMKEGVHIVDPATTWIDPDVRFESDVRLEPGVILKGKSLLKMGSEIRAYSVIESSEIGAHSIVGPFARLRSGTILENDVHIGNFVEIKKSRLKKGVKAGHLAYLGDSEIGHDTNIGAGTITCNFDGFSKHSTIIEDGVFIGSNTSLVAPVKVGRGAMVGAGSVITKDVSANALAVERSEQRNIENKAERLRSKKKPSRI
jgi:bifunctional UDP-N-acetylglucosamine pyrophosphorylase/glucosamine-1-phosphate N-acetyltransferase